MEQTIQLKNGVAKGYCIDAGAFNVIFCTTGKGMVACGAFNVEALGKFGYPTVRVQSPVKTIEDVLEAQVVEVNPQAVELGITEKMTGKESLEKMF